jgi:NitT/TauT family transport system ATP-binding protein
MWCVLTPGSIEWRDERRDGRDGRDEERMSEGDVLVDVQRVGLTLGETRILDGVSFQIRDRVRAGTITGQVVALLGPSGVGKTRLLRIIAGLDRPGAGSVCGQGGAELAAGSVGYVFQDYSLLAHRTVRGNLVLAGTIGGLTPAEADARASKLLETFDVAARANAYPSALSGGQRQRIAIAQQIMCPRRLLLMDEPFSGLDPAAVSNVMALIQEVANLDELNTVLLVTHDIRAAMAVSDTLHMLGRERSAGKIVPGASIRASYDLVDRGLAWTKGVQMLPQFAALEREIAARFDEL